MFRARIYAQGFTLIALVGGSIFWKDDRMKRKELEKVLEEKRAAEKREKWLRELERRDREDREWRGRFEDVALRAKEAEEGAMAMLKHGGKKAEEAVGADAKVRGRQGAEKVEDKAEMVAEETREGAHQGKERLKRARAKAVEVGGKVEETAEGVAERAQEEAKKGKETRKAAIERVFQNKSVLEQVQGSGWGRGTWTIGEAWRRI
jgi:Hypoxia induced protein conserved region